MNMKINGHVTLVGAGPGDPELLTVKAIRAIRRATLLLVDDLVGDGVLRYARRSARTIYVGKPDGTGMTKASTTDLATHPVWSPSGKLAWVGGEAKNGSQRIYVEGKPASPSGFAASAPRNLRAMASRSSTLRHARSSKYQWLRCLT